jgi:hypothetical protein
VVSVACIVMYSVLTYSLLMKEAFQIYSVCTLICINGNSVIPGRHIWLPVVLIDWLVGV